MTSAVHVLLVHIFGYLFRPNCDLPPRSDCRSLSMCSVSGRFMFVCRFWVTVGILTSIIVANGPARILVKSTTLIPASGLSSFTMAGVEKLRRCDIEDAYSCTPGGAEKVLSNCKGLSLNRAIRNMLVSVVWSQQLANLLTDVMIDVSLHVSVDMFL